MGKSTPTNALAVERARKAVGLRIAGATYEAIADATGLSTRSGAYKAVARGLAMVERETKESASSLRALELSRLDRLQIGLWPAARNGDTKAVASVLRIMERRAKLLGLDRPVQVEHEHVHRTFEIVIPPPALGPHKASAIEVDAVEVDEYGNVAAEQEER